MPHNQIPTTGLTEGLYKLQATPHSVDLFSSKRLPFEPKGWVKAMRDGLKRDLKGLDCHRGELLDCHFISCDRGFFDFENVLTYNVGSGAFKHLATQEVRLTKHHRAPRRSNDGVLYPYHHHYGKQRLETPLPQWCSSPAASWSFDLPRTLGPIKTHDYWWAMKNGDVSVAKEGSLAGSRFGLVLTLQTQRQVNIVGKMKSLLDGIVSALHFHEAEVNPDVLTYLSRELGRNESEIAAALLDRSMAMLGGTDLVRPYRQGVMWYPQDDLCEGIVIRSAVVSDQAERCWGEVFEI